jgi:hypothetical protein
MNLGLKRFGAAFAGLVTIVLLTIATDVLMHTRGVFPPPGQPMSNSLWLMSTLYRIVYGVLGCWVAARLAPDHPRAHAMSLGVLGTGLGVAGPIATWGRGPGFGPPWYPIAVALMPIPCAWLGATVAGLQRRPPA